MSKGIRTAFLIAIWLSLGVLLHSCVYPPPTNWQDPWTLAWITVWPLGLLLIIAKWLLLICLAVGGIGLMIICFGKARFQLRQQRRKG